METSKVKDLLQKTKQLALKGKAKELADHFEQFYDLFERREHSLHDPEFQKRLDEAYQQFRASYLQAAAEFGFITKAPENSEAPTYRNNLKKNNKKLRI